MPKVSAQLGITDATNAALLIRPRLPAAVRASWLGPLSLKPDHCGSQNRILAGHQSLPETFTEKAYRSGNCPQYEQARRDKAWVGPLLGYRLSRLACVASSMRVRFQRFRRRRFIAAAPSPAR
jgi:hypothetical protein